MTTEEAYAISDELGLELRVIHNGFYFKRKNQIVTIYKYTWDYNMGTRGRKWKNFKGDHCAILRNIFKKLT